MQFSFNHHNEISINKPCGNFWNKKIRLGCQHGICGNQITELSCKNNLCWQHYKLHCKSKNWNPNFCEKINLALDNLPNMAKMNIEIGRLARVLNVTIDSLLRSKCILQSKKDRYRAQSLIQTNIPTTFGSFSIGTRSKDSDRSKESNRRIKYSNSKSESDFERARQTRLKRLRKTRISDRKKYRTENGYILDGFVVSDN